MSLSSKHFRGRIIANLAGTAIPSIIKILNAVSMTCRHSHRGKPLMSAL